jgi:N-formylglutamate amidohydrolase
MIVSETRNPFTIYNGEALSAPILLSVPHAGRDYPHELLAHLRVPPSDLQRLEDRYADRLIQSAVAAGLPAIVAHKPRAWIDINRAETDIDVQMLTGADKPVGLIASAKTRGGLGLVPRRLSVSGELWRGPITYADIQSRIALAHRPYHTAIERILAAMRARFGIAILLDVHTMPSLSPLRQGYNVTDWPPQIVVGDRFGKSAASIYPELIMMHAKAQGHQVALNNPYSGDYILHRHGNPDHNTHAIQLEIDRGLYLDSAMREPTPGLADMARLVHDIASILVDYRSGYSIAEAAE